MRPFYFNAFVRHIFPEEFGAEGDLLPELSDLAGDHMSCLRKEWEVCVMSS